MQRLREIPYRRLAPFVAALALLAAGGTWLLLRGGPENPPPGDAGPGQQSLVRVGDLPGTGWSSADTPLQRAANAGDELVSSAPAAPECESMRALERTLAGADAAFDSGESRAVERREGDRLLARITHTRMSFSDSTALAATTAGLESALADDSLSTCLDQAAAANGIDLDVQPSVPAAPVPGPGGARAFLLSAGEGAGAERMVEHIYWWREDSTLWTLVIATWGDEADVSAIVAAASGVSR